MDKKLKKCAVKSCKNKIEVPQVFCKECHLNGKLDRHTNKLVKKWNSQKLIKKELFAVEEKEEKI